MRVAVARAVAQLLHQLGGRVAQVHGHGAGAVFAHEGAGALVGHVGGVALGGHGQIQRALGQRQLAFGAAQALINLGSVQRQAQGARVGQADVFTGHADQAAGDVARVHAAIEHARQPVQRGVRVAAAHAFVQGADGVVELLAALVVAAQALAQHFQQPLIRDARAFFGARGHRQRLQRIEQAARVAIGIGHQAVRCGRLGGQAVQRGQGAGQDFAQIRFFQRLEHVHRRARKQGGIDFKRGVFRGRADEGEQAAFHVRQKSILLAFVEAVHFVHEHDGGLWRKALLCGLGALHGFADVFHAAQHGADGDELRVKRLRHQPCDGRFARARRPPENAAVRLP